MNGFQTCADRLFIGFSQLSWFSSIRRRWWFVGPGGYAASSFSIPAKMKSLD